MISEIDKYVIGKVKERRLQQGLSQSQLAFELDVPTSFIAMIESGQYNKKYNVTHINNLAKALNCSPKDFMPETAF
ncbi:MAG: helix-turn-helix transcriptional regulator [Flavipsychrobacter sp.]|nr:helix-turn-helix transcriptional regulator [Flavipsychrobacter sp.]